MRRNPATEKDLEETLLVAADAAEELGDHRKALAIRYIAQGYGPDDLATLDRIRKQFMTWGAFVEDDMEELEGVSWKR